MFHRKNQSITLYLVMFHRTRARRRGRAHARRPPSMMDETLGGARLPCSCLALSAPCPLVTRGSFLAPRGCALPSALSMVQGVGRPRLPAPRSPRAPAGAVACARSRGSLLISLRAVLGLLSSSCGLLGWSFGRVGCCALGGACPCRAPAACRPAAPSGTPLGGSRFARHSGFLFFSATAWCCGSHFCGFPHVRSLTWFAPHSCAPIARWLRTLSIMRGAERPAPLRPLGRRHGRGDFLGGLIAAPRVPPASVFHGIGGLPPVK